MENELGRERPPLRGVLALFVVSGHVKPLVKLGGQRDGIPRIDASCHVEGVSGADGALDCPHLRRHGDVHIGVKHETAPLSEVRRTADLARWQGRHQR